MTIDRHMLRFGLTAAAILLAACQPEPLELLRLDVPVEDLDQAAIIAVTLGDKTTVQASPISADQTIDPLQLPYDRTGEIRVAALLYEDTLETLEIERGLLARATDPTQDAPLPDADRIHRATIVDEQFAEWVRAMSLPEDVASFRIARANPCGTFDIDYVSLGTAAEPAFALAVDDTWTMVTTSTRLIGDADPTVVFVDGDTVVAQSDLPASIFSGYREDSGRLWLGGERGVIYEARFDANPQPHITLTVSSTVGSREDVIGLDGPPSGTPDERFAISTNREDTQWGAFEWYDGTRWDQPGVRRNTLHDVAWVEPGYGLYPSFFRDALVFGSRDGQEISITVDSVVLGSVIAMARIDGFGLVAGTSAGGLHRLPEGGTWSRIGGGTAEEIGDIQRYEEGLVYLAGNALARYVGSEDVRCDEWYLTRPELDLVRSMAVSGRDVLVPARVRNRGEDELGEQFVVRFTRRD